MRKTDKYPNISYDLFITRTKNLNGDNLLFVFRIMKAICIVAAVTAVFNIVSNIDLKSLFYGSTIEKINMVLDVLSRILLFSISFLIMIVTYDGAFFGTLFLSRIPTRIETSVTFFHGGLELALFSILFPSAIIKGYPNNATDIDNRIVWFFIFSMYCLCGRLIIGSAINSIKVNNFPIRLRYLVKDYLESLNKPFRDSKISFVIGMVMFLLLFCKWLYFYYLPKVIYTSNPLMLSEITPNSTLWICEKVFICLISIVQFYFISTEYVNQHSKRQDVARQLSRL